MYKWWWTRRISNPSASTTGNYSSFAFNAIFHSIFHFSILYIRRQWRNKNPFSLERVRFNHLSAKQLWIKWFCHWQYSIGGISEAIVIDCKGRSDTVFFCSLIKIHFHLTFTSPTKRYSIHSKSQTIPVFVGRKNESNNIVQIFLTWMIKYRKSSIICDFSWFSAKHNIHCMMYIFFIGSNFFI